MKNFSWVAAGLLALAVGCKTPLALQKSEPQKNIRVTADIAEDPKISAIIAPYKKSMEAQMNTKLSHTAVELTKTGDNSLLGNLLADYTLAAAQQWAAQNNIPRIDAAIINSGGIRSSISKGDILVRNVYEVMPFENELVIVKMKGTDLPELFEYYRRTQKNNPVSHLNVEIRNGQLAKALINGAPVDSAKTYYIATSDFLALGGDNMLFFAKGEMISTGRKLRDLYVEQFRNTVDVVAPTDTRLIFDQKAKSNEP